MFHLKKIKKTVFAISLCAMIFSEPSLAQEENLNNDVFEKKVSVSSSLRTRFELRNNKDFDSSMNDHTDFVGTRVRLGFKFFPTKDMEIFIQPQFSGAWGQSQTNLNSSGLTSNGVLTSGELLDPSINIHQAYVTKYFGNHVKFSLGRQELQFGEHLVLGNVGYSNVGRSFDGVLLSWEYEKSKLDTFYTRLAEDDVNGSAYTGNDDFSGIYYSLSEVTPKLTNFDVYGFWLLRGKNTGFAEFNFATIGLREKMKIGPWDSRLEAGYQIGEKSGQAMRAWMIDIEEGINFKSIGEGLRFALEYNFASGNKSNSSKFTRWHSLFPTAHKWLGYMDVLGRQNIQSGVAHIELNWTSKLRFTVDAHSFWRAESSDLLYGLDAESIVSGQGGVPTSAEKHVGEELDLVAIYKLNKNIDIQVMSGIFLPGDYIKNTIGEDVSYFSFVQTNFKY